MTIYVGIDWCKAKWLVCYGPAQRGPVAATVSAGAGPANAFATKLQEEYPEAQIVVVIEAGAPVLAHILQQRGFEVHVVDGKQAKNFARSLSSSSSKNDKADAKILWKLAQSPAHLREPLEPPAEETRALRRVLVHLDQVTADRVRAVNRLRAVLQEEVPALELHLHNFESRYVRALAGLVPTGWHAKQFTDADWDAVISQHLVPKQKRGPLRAAIADATQYVVDGPETAAAKAAVVSGLLQQIELLLGQEAEAEKQLQKLVEGHESSVARSLKGVGTMLSANVAARLFPNGPGPDRDEGAKRGSAAPVRVQTGTTTDRTMFRRSTDPRARAATHCLGLQAVRHLAWARASYKWAKNRGTRPSTAIRQIARAVLRIIRALMKSQEAYDDARYVAALKSKGVPWAATL